MKSTRIFCMALALILVFATVSFAGAVRDKLTDEEFERAKKGEIILKNEIDDKTKSGAGIGIGYFSGDIDKFWKLVYDYPNYQNVFPRMIYAKKVGGTPERFLTELKMDATLTKLVYTTYNVPSPNGMELNFGIEKSKPHKYFKDMTGYWKLEKVDGGGFLAEYKVAVSLDLPLGMGKLVTPVVNAMAGKDLPDLFNALRKNM